jgi:hypothetical protein
LTRFRLVAIFIEGVDQRTPGFKDSQFVFLKLPGNHASHFDHMPEPDGLIFTPVWDVEDAWHPKKAYKLLVVANGVSTYKRMGLSVDRMDGADWFKKVTDMIISKATDFFKDDGQSPRRPAD